MFRVVKEMVPFREKVWKNDVKNRKKENPRNGWENSILSGVE
jgi:hypothetical protein